jgi:hypothetical protein
MMPNTESRVTIHMAASLDGFIALTAREEQRLTRAWKAIDSGARSSATQPGVAV